MENGEKRQHHLHSEDKLLWGSEMTVSLRTSLLSALMEDVVVDAVVPRLKDPITPAPLPAAPSAEEIEGR